VIYAAATAAKIISQIPNRKPQWERDGLPPPEQQEAVLSRLYAEPRPAAPMPGYLPEEHPGGTLHWEAVNRARARMDLPPVSFREWYAGAPLEAETIYPESAAELKRMKPTVIAAGPKGTKRRPSLRVSTQSGTIPPPVDNQPA
jgi:hypothetical protein